MKKLILISACALFAATSFAQQDTTKTQTPQPTQQPSNQIREDKDLQGWTRVQTTDVPASLRTTLGGTQYTGWESGTVYMNQSGDTYALRTSGNNAKTYYFDSNGKATKKPAKKDGN